MKDCTKTQWGHLPKRAWQADEIIFELEQARLGEDPCQEFDRVMRGGIELCDALLHGLPHITSMETALMAGEEESHSATFCLELSTHGARGLLKEGGHIVSVKKILQNLADGTRQTPEEIEFAEDFFLEVLKALNEARSTKQAGNIW